MWILVQTYQKRWPTGTDDENESRESMSRQIHGQLVVFYGITTLVGYLMPNPVDTYVMNI